MVSLRLGSRRSMQPFARCEGQVDAWDQNHRRRLAHAHGGGTTLAPRSIMASPQPSASAAPPAPLSGRDVEGRYRIGLPVGEGATSRVYAARSLAPALRDHGRSSVVVKVLTDSLVGDADAIARFTHEAYLASRIEHPNVVGVLDFGWIEPGRPYLVMRRTPGATLDRLLEATGPLPPRLALDLIAEAAAGLKALHRLGIVHRDVKPANLLCALRAGRRPRVRLIDLGVAGVFDARRARKLDTRDIFPGAYGTPAYLAPEQALGRRVDARADVYALACVAYRALTGVEPFHGQTVARTVLAQIHDDATPASHVNAALPAAVDGVLARGMAKHPEMRTSCPLRLVAGLASAVGIPLARARIGAKAAGIDAVSPRRRRRADRWRSTPLPDRLAG
jgi:serine/threonine-protein kinase